MKNVLLVVLVGGSLVGCDQAQQPHQQNYTQQTAYYEADGRTMDAAQRSRDIALASMRQTLLQARNNNRFDCDADDDISDNNLTGDGDADCEVYQFGRKDQYECPSSFVGICKLDSKRVAKPAGYVYGYHAKTATGSYPHTPTYQSKTLPSASSPAKPTPTHPTTGFFGSSTTNSVKQGTVTVVKQPAIPSKPASGFFSTNNTKSSSGSTTASTAMSSTRSHK